MTIGSPGTPVVRHDAYRITVQHTNGEMAEVHMIVNMGVEANEDQLFQAMTTALAADTNLAVVATKEWQSFAYITP